MTKDKQCICPKDCDCQDAKPKRKGLVKISNNCPIHNDGSIPVPECPADKHRGGQEWPEAED